MTQRTYVPGCGQTDTNMVPRRRLKGSGSRQLEVGMSEAGSVGCGGDRPGHRRRADCRGQPGPAGLDGRVHADVRRPADGRVLGKPIRTQFGLSEAQLSWVVAVAVLNGSTWRCLPVGIVTDPTRPQAVQGRQRRRVGDEVHRPVDRRWHRRCDLPRLRPPVAPGNPCSLVPHGNPAPGADPTTIDESGAGYRTLQEARP